VARDRDPTAPAAGSGSLSELSDAELLEGIRGSSEAHFAALYDRYFPRIYRYVEQRLKGNGDPEEVVQEVFVAVFRSLGNYRGESSLVAWIYGIAKNTLNASWRRAAQQRSKMEAIDPVQLQPSKCVSDCTPEEQLVMRQLVGLISEQMGDLSEWQAEVFAMRHFQNLSIREISARTDRTSESVRSSLYRTKRLFYDTAALGRAKRQGA
jgi:RNA polymerase sigma-70 factor (ECF subfamily)